MPIVAAPHLNMHLPDFAIPQAYAGVRVLVLGATGFIGRWVARSLTEAGADMVLVVRDRAAAAPLMAQWGIRGGLVEVDLSADDALAEVWRVARPSVTFNLAGYGVDPAERDAASAEAINARLVERLARLIADHADPSWPGRHLVHAGSALEYGDVAGTVTEATVPCPATLYGRSKLQGTQLLADACRTTRLRAVTARLFMVYGAGEHHGRLLPGLLREAGRSGELRLTSGEQRRDFTYVEDAAEGLLRLGVTRDLPDPIVNLSTGRLTRVRDVVELAAVQLGIPSARLCFGALPTRPEEMTRITAISNERLRSVTGWVPPTAPTDGIARMIRRHRELSARVEADR